MQIKGVHAVQVFKAGNGEWAVAFGAILVLDETTANAAELVTRFSNSDAAWRFADKLNACRGCQPPQQDPEDLVHADPPGENPTE